MAITTTHTHTVYLSSTVNFSVEVVCYSRYCDTPPSPLSSSFPPFHPPLCIYVGIHIYRLCNNNTFSSGEFVVGTVEVDVPPSDCPHHIDISQNDQIIDHINNSCFLRELYYVHLEVLSVPSVASVSPGCSHGLLLVSHGEWLVHM